MSAFRHSAKKVVRALVGVALAFQSLQADPQLGDPLAFGDQILHVHHFQLSKEIEARIDKIRSGRNYRINRNWNRDGFYAALAMKGDRLYLTKLSIDARSEEFKGGTQPVPLSADGQSEPIFAGWFSGELVDYHRDRPGYVLAMSLMRVRVFEGGVLVKTEDRPVPKLEGGEHGQGVADETIFPWIVGDAAIPKAETARALQQESSADFITTYYKGEKFDDGDFDGGKLGIGVGRTMQDRRINHGKEVFYPTLFELDELEVFFDDQKHKASIVVLIVSHVHTRTELKRLVISLRDYFVARGYAEVVIQQMYGRGEERRICLEHTVDQEAERGRAGRPATVPESKSKGKEKPKPESEGRSG